MSEVVLHGYWRSTAAYRVRIALALKGIAYRQITHDLRAGEQREAAYLALAPHGLVPAVEHDGTVLIESPAILEWLETRWPTPSLLPPRSDEAAIVRAMGALIACDIHPLNNLRVLNTLRRQFDATEDQVQSWIATWISHGLEALETLVTRHGGKYAFGDTPTLADCYLVPQLYSAERYRVNCAAYPRVLAAARAACDVPAVASAHPDRQPDAPR